jgi:hypothetical protein
MLGRHVEIDLSGIGGLPEGEGCFFDTASRITPPPGRYPVLLYRNGQGAAEAEVSVERGGVFIASPFNADLPVERIEFVTERR